MNRSKIFVLGFGLMGVLLIVSMFYYSRYIQPKIHFTAKLTGISNQEYKTIVDSKQVDVSNRGMGEYRKISISISVSQPFGVDFGVKINRDILVDYLRNNPKAKMVTGGSFEHGNGREYEENAVVLLDNIPEKELRELLKDFKYTVSWRDLSKEKNNRVFYLKDYID